MFNEKISGFPQKIIVLYLPKFLMTFFLFLLRGAKSVADIDAGGNKIRTFRQIHNAIITLSASEGGQTPLTTSMRGRGRICPPWIRHWVQLCFAYLQKIASLWVFSGWWVTDPDHILSYLSLWPGRCIRISLSQKVLQQQFPQMVTVFASQ